LDLLWPGDLAKAGVKFENAEEYFTYLMSDGVNTKVIAREANRLVPDLSPSMLIGPGMVEAKAGGPVLPENNEALREIARHTTVPIATGERMFSRWDFKNVLHEGYVDIIQPDLSHAGGISECKKIAAMAEAYDVAVAPHCPLGPVALAACVQLDACTPNAFIQEQSLGIHYNRGGELLDYVRDPSIYQYKDGFLKLPTGPGLGVEVNEDALIRAAQTPHNWKNPLWRNADGSVAEW
jgi:galactonate dehydratase